MKKSVSPAVVIIAVLLLLVLVFVIYRFTLGKPADTDGQGAADEGKAPGATLTPAKDDEGPAVDNNDVLSGAPGPGG